MRVAKKENCIRKLTAFSNGCCFFVAIKNEAGFFVYGKIQHISIVNINFVYEERGIKYAVCNFKR